MREHTRVWVELIALSLHRLTMPVEKRARIFLCDPVIFIEAIYYQADFEILWRREERGKSFLQLNKREFQGNSHFPSEDG